MGDIFRLNQDSFTNRLGTTHKPKRDVLSTENGSKAPTALHVDRILITNSICYQHCVILIYDGSINS
jgi:hypothetical protein